MRLSSGYENKKARVEMLPLIDVVFLLLVFFIYAMVSMAVHRGIRLDLPAASTAILENETHIAVAIDAENTVYLNAEPVPFEGLIERILALRGNSSLPVFIDGDRHADLGRAIELLNDLKQAGIKEVSFSCKTETP